MAELRIVLRGDLCAASGEATGLTVDRDICMDAYGFPYIPARRIKGILREAAETLYKYGDDRFSENAVNTLFGTTVETGKFRITDAVLPEIDQLHACVRSAPKALERAAAPMNIIGLFTSVRGQTQLRDGVAVDHTLRFTRVLNQHNALHPERDTELVAQVTWMNGTDDTLLQVCCDAVRHMGSKRSRGLGNIRVLYDSAKTVGKHMDPPAVPPEGDQFRIHYTLRLDAPVTLPGCAELLEEIPARSVIGCLAAQCEPESVMFDDLFLNGTARWSALTPCSGGARSAPAPFCLVRGKDDDVYANLLTAPKEALEGKKQKSVDGSYLALTGNGASVIRVHSSTVYHHSHSGDMLYMQESLNAGMLYGGYVTVPRRLAADVLKLLCSARFSFGRSKTAQYGGCTLTEPPKIQALYEEPRRLPAGTPVWVLLESDLVLMRHGVYLSDAASVRAALAKLLKLNDTLPDGTQDHCRNRSISGYQTQWRMPKPPVPAMCGGSIFGFHAGGEAIPANRQLGEFPQEGMGVFRVLTGAELAEYDHPVKSEVDEWIPKIGSERDVLRKAMATAELERQFTESVSELYRRKGKALQVRKGTLGRVRQMLAEAEDFDDFKKRITSIKPSDAHSDNLIPDRDRALELAIAIWDETCGKQEELLALLDGDVTKVWKKPVMQIIHLMYYGK